MPERITALPEALDGSPWRVEQSEPGQESKVDIYKHHAVLPPAVTEGLSQTRYHELAKVNLGMKRAPRFKDKWTQALALSLEELRLDLLLEANGIPQDERLDDRQWDSSTHTPGNSSQQARFLLENCWPAQGKNEELLKIWGETFSRLETDVPGLIDELKRIIPEFQKAIQYGGDGIVERNQIAERVRPLLREVTDPPAGGPGQGIPEEISPQVKEKITRSEQREEPMPQQPQRNRGVLKKVEKPKPAPKPQPEPEPKPEPKAEEKPDEEPEGPGTPPPAELPGEPSGEADGDSAPGSSGEDSANAEPPSTSEDAGSKQAPESEAKSDGGESGSDAEDAEDPDQEDAESESESEELGEDFEEEELEEYEMEYDSEAAAEDRELQRIEKIVTTKSKGGLAVFDPQKPAGHGGTPRIGTMLIHDHLSSERKSHVVRRTSGARDRGVNPVHMHRYTMDGAIFSNRRAGGSVLIDGSGSMNWDPNYLEKVMQYLPMATVAIYHGGDTDWAATTKLGLTRMMPPEFNRDAYYAADRIRRIELEKAMEEFHKSVKKEAQAKGLDYRSTLWQSPRWTQKDVEINGTLCILGRDGRWGPMGHERGGGNDVDVEALQWLAAQKPPRIWISDFGVCGGTYHEMLHNTDDLQKLCLEIMRRHRIQRVETVTQALKLLGFRIPALEKQGV